MNKTTKAGLLFATLLFTLFTTKVQAQSQPRYKDVVVENPNAEADMKVVADFVNSLVSGDQVKAKSLLADGYKAHGPGPIDSATAEQTMSAWQENYKTQTNRKINFVTQTFRVLQGDLKGNWVSLWGDYSFSQNSKTVTFPLQYTARVTNGKIDMDRVYYDRLYILQTLGFKVTPPEN